MEKFLALSHEKQATIRNAALACFARHGSFMFSGPVMMIMNQLHRLELEDILIEEPSLEEVFLHYYE